MGWIGANRRIASAALTAFLAVGTLASESAAADYPRDHRNTLAGFGFQTEQESPEEGSTEALTRAERKDLKRAQAEEKARARAEAKQARQRAKEAEKAEKEEADQARQRAKETRGDGHEGAKTPRQLAKEAKAAEKERRREEKKRKRQGLPGPTVIRVQAVDIDEHDGEVGLTIRTSAEPSWLVGESSDGGIALRLLRALPEDGLSPQVRQSGIVAAVDVTIDRTEEAPSTLIEIATRVPVLHSVRPTEDGIQLRLRPSRRAPDAVILTSPSELDATIQNAEYKIGAGDVLAIEVFGLPELSRKLRVEGIGTINFPLLGTIDIVGLSLRDAEAKLANLLSTRGLVNDPVVVMAVDELVSRGVTVQGAVNKPGLYQLFGPKTLLELLVETGGLANGESAGRTIHVFRRAPDGGQLRTEIDAERLLEQGDLTLNVALQPGDIIQVPQPQRLRVYVSGAVRSPGPIDYLDSDRLTLLQAITSAGGPTERARLSAVQVIRRHEDGTEERFVLDVKKISNGKLEDFPLERGDTVVLKDWFF